MSNTITLKGIIDEDLVNYKVPVMTLMSPYCSFKCDKECGQTVCQNSSLVQLPEIKIDIDKLCNRYLGNPITKGICFQGLEPLDSFNELAFFVYHLRIRKKCDDPIIIYTGYNFNEVIDKMVQLSMYGNIIVKFGRYIPNQKPHFDEVLGVYLASDNQYAEEITYENYC